MRYKKALDLCERIALDCLDGKIDDFKALDELEGLCDEFGVNKSFIFFAKSKLDLQKELSSNFVLKKNNCLGFSKNNVLDFGSLNFFNRRKTLVFLKNKNGLQLGECSLLKKKIKV
ncbi:MAG: hypothetical protein QXI10_03590 [Candidatus Diapherotrites archaeon]